MQFDDVSVRAALDSSIELNGQLISIDAGLVAAARAVADRIDAAVASADGQELTKALYLVPHVTNLLREMLATPASRNAANIAKEVVGGKLSHLRSVQGGKGAAGA